MKRNVGVKLSPLDASTVKSHGQTDHETNTLFSKSPAKSALPGCFSGLQNQTTSAFEEAEGGGSEYLPNVVAMNLRDLVPLWGLPRTGYPSGQEVKWLGNDSLKNYQLSGGHPLYGENDIIYSLNSLGYRCPEFDVSADVRIVAIGCSYVLGVALPQRAVFHELFAEKLRAIISPKTVLVWNLGLGGASNDYISRLLYFAVPRLNPQIVLINFTHFARREYVSVQNRYMNYSPTYEPTDETAKNIFGHFGALSSPLDDELNFFKNYKAVECLLNRFGCQWFYSHAKAQKTESGTSLVDLHRCVGSLQVLDRGRDNGHPGPDSHCRLAELYWAKFNELGGMGYFVES